MSASADPDPTSPTPAGLFLRFDAQRVASGYRRAGLRLEEPPLVALARAVASSPALREAEDLALVVPDHPGGLMGFLGPVDPLLRSRLQALTWQIDFALDRLVYLDPPEVRRACEELGEALVEACGRSTLREMDFEGIPRGGLLVLGTLAYVLDLPGGRMDGSRSGDRPRVVVDDAAYTGTRFRRWLHAHPDGDLVFAPLFSHPALRDAVASEPRVRACVSARDLTDHAPRHLGGEHRAWVERWMREEGGPYWVGHTEHVCFPWGEPDIAVRNADSGEEEPGFRVVPPSFCLKNRPAAGVRVERQSTGEGPLRPREGVLFTRSAGRVLVADTRTGSVLALEGVGAEIWAALVERGTVSGVVGQLADLYAVERDRLRADVEAFVSDLSERALLERVDGR